MANTKKDPGAPTVIHACTSVDEITVALLDRIKAKFELTRADAGRMIVGLAIEKEIKMSDVALFQKKVATENKPSYEQQRFNWSPEENAMLHAYAKRLFGNNNRSEAFRILVAYFAVESKLAVMVPSDKFTILPA
jgi:hypothetical protein